MKNVTVKYWNDVLKYSRIGEYLMPKINQIQEVTVLQTDIDGLVTGSKSEKNVTYSIESEPPYVKMYLDTVLYLSDLPKSYNPVLSAILMRMPWANQCQDIAINSGVKRRIAKELGISVSRINNALTDFVKGKLLYRVDTGVYQVNPNIFGRGEWADIKKLRLEISFDASGKTIMAEIEKNKKPTEQETNVTAC